MAHQAARLDFFRCTSRMDTAAGVTPATRAAWPTVAGLSNEVRQKLAQIRPATVGQAARVAGVTPAAVSILLVHLKKTSRAA